MLLEKRGEEMDLWRAVQEMLNDYYDSFGRLDMESGKAARIFPEIMAKAGQDLKFREKILEAPVEALERKGFRLPKGFHLKFVEESENTIHIPLLPFVGEGAQTDDKAQLTELDEVIQMAVTDLDFRNQLVRDPEAVLKERGFEIDPAKKVVILECTDDLFYAILPPVEKPKSSEPRAVEMEIRGDTIHLSGRLDANGVEQVRDTFLNWEGPLTLDLGRLDYISSAGLGLLLMTLKKQKQSSYEMQLVNLKPDVRNVFVLAGFDQLFQL
jgi:anti-anti-sigma factor